MSKELYSKLINFDRLWRDVLIVSWALFKVMIPTLVIVKIAQETGLVDPKSRLSELCQAADAQPPEYRLVGKEGPDHAPLHRVIVLWSQQEPVFGQGKGIKEAQRMAATTAIDSWFEGGH